jgi:ribosomal protein S8
VLTDPIADMLTRIRNANKALHEHATMPSSRMKVNIAKCCIWARSTTASTNRGTG